MITQADFEDVVYFRAKEFECQHCGKNEISLHLVKKLDKLRELYGLPISVTSGFRCTDHPLSVSRPTSSHILGEACDLSAKTSRERYVLLELIFKHELFKRIGISGKDNFIHVDVDKKKSQMLTWVY
jgi:zinc D-Ala-D-Ala carboxypeptidase